MAKACYEQPHVKTVRTLKKTFACLVNMNILYDKKDMSFLQQIWLYCNPAEPHQGKLLESNTRYFLCVLHQMLSNFSVTND